MAPIENVAIIGAGGHVGGFIVKALVEQGKHRITGITRADSKATMPSGLAETKTVDYSNHESLVEALKGQDILIITLGVMAKPDTQQKLVDACKDAGVKYVMPNEWGQDPALNEQMDKDVMLGTGRQEVRAYIEKAGLTWIGLCCSSWYEFSLSGAEMRYGFDFKQKKLTLFDDGNIKIHTSTWPQCGRAVATLLALPDLKPWANKAVHVSSFFISQRDMLESVLRVTGGKESDWTISHEDVQERYKRGVKMFQQGNFVGFAILLYARMFFPDAAPSLEGHIDNEKLGLPEEGLDEFTKVATKYVESGQADGWTHL